MRNKHSEEQDKYLIENVKGITLKELTKKFNTEFNLNLSESSIANRKTKLGLKSGITGGQFQKGQTPYNKGKKMPPYVYKKVNPTMFKKGHIPENHREVGSERINKDGYIEIKIKEPNKWELKHRYIYESMYGNIPTGYKLIFADGDRQNINIDNLILVSPSEELIINSRGLYKREKELTKTGALIAKVIDRTNKLKRKE